MRRKTFRRDWLSDRSSYPLIMIISTGFVFAAGVGVACLASNPDVQLSPSKRLSKIRTWEN